MMIFKKAIPRRTFLRGIGRHTGACRCWTRWSRRLRPRAERPQPSRRSVSDFVYVPNGIIMDKWTPATEGAGFELTPILEPLAPFRDRLLVLSGLSSHKRAAAARAKTRRASARRRHVS